MFEHLWPEMRCMVGYLVFVVQAFILFLDSRSKGGFWCNAEWETNQKPHA